MKTQTMNPTQVRDTKYCRAIMAYLEKVHHATNTMILIELQKEFPNLSATTVHRATTRLSQRGSIRIAPADYTGAMRYDINIENHDHFMCSACGRLRDVRLAETVLPLLEEQLDGCHISGDIVISGRCKECEERG